MATRKTLATDPLKHLQKSDALLGALIERIGPLETARPKREDHFLTLARIIVGQQLSTRAAGTIWGRVAEHFGGKLTPESVLAAEKLDLRGLGLSGQKAGYLHSLAQHVIEGSLKTGELEKLPDEEVIREITAVKGLGPWSADMFLMFHLERPDVLAVGDLGIREAARRLYDLEERPDAVKLEELAEPWRPYRTLACRYLWKSLE